MKTYFLIICTFLYLVHPILSQKTKVSDDFEELFTDLFEESEPGGSILVMKGDDVKFQANYGLANLETGEKITENSIFNTGSISKTFVSNAILVLYERGKLSIKDPISKYFDDFDDPEMAENVTIEHLLSHTSGLPDIRNVSSNREFFLTAKDMGNWEPIKKAKRFNFDPGSDFEYSNPAFNGLALIIEQVSGKKWQDFVRDEIFAKSGMKASTITDGEQPNSGVSHGYIIENRKFIESDYGEVPTFAAAGNGGIWSSVLELAQYEKALQSSAFLSHEMLEQSRIPFHPENWTGSIGPNIGHSWFLDNGSRFGLESDDVAIVYHTGSQGGFRSYFISVPEKDVLYIALFNRPFDEYGHVMNEGLRILERAEWCDE